MENSEKNLIKILFFSLFFILSCCESYAANKKIQSFSKSKKIMFNIYKNNQNTFYCGCSYKDKIPNLESCGYKPYRNKKELLVLNGNIFCQHRDLEKFDTWRYGHKKCVKNNGKNLKDENVLKKFIKI